MHTSQLNPDPKLRPLCRGCPLPWVAMHGSTFFFFLLLLLLTTAPRNATSGLLHVPLPPLQHHLPSSRAGRRFPTSPPPRPQAVPNLLVSAGPEDGQDEHGGDRRSQGAGDSLDVDVELATAGALQDGEPDHAEDHQQHRHHPARDSGDTRATTGHPNGISPPGCPAAEGGAEELAGGCGQVLPPRGQREDVMPRMLLPHVVSHPSR